MYNLYSCKYYSDQELYLNFGVQVLRCIYDNQNRLKVVLEVKKRIISWSSVPMLHLVIDHSM